MATIAEILMAQGQQAADARRQQGQNSAQLFSNLGQIASAVPLQMQQAKRNDQENKLRALEVTHATDAEKSSRAFEAALKDPANYNPDGTTKDQAIADTLRKQDIGAYEHWVGITAATRKSALENQKTQAEIDASRVSTGEKLQLAQQAKTQHLGAIAFQMEKMLDAKPDDPLHARDTALAGVARAAADHLISEDEAKQFIGQTATASPAQLKQVFSQFVTPEARTKGEKDLLENAKLSGDIAQSAATTAKTTAETQGTLPPTLAQIETSRHNKEMERIAGLTQGREQAALNETKRHNGAMEGASSPLVQRSYQFSKTALDKLQDPINKKATDLATAHEELNAKTPAADALIVPKILSVTTGGQGSGVRINEAEISRVLGGRTEWETLKAKLNKFQSDPSKGLSITDAQREQLGQLIDLASERIQSKADILMKANQDLVDAENPLVHRQILSDAQKNLLGIDLSVGKAKDGKALTELPAGASVTSRP